jgi:hypothetical protein
MDNPRLKHWPILFLVIFIEGIVTLIWLGLLPPDAKNAILLGFSSKRLMMMAFILVILAATAFCGWLSWRKPGWMERWVNPNRQPRLFRWLTIGSLVIAFGLELAILFLRYYDPVRLTALYIRSKPLLGFLFLACLQSAIWLLLLRFGRDLRLFWAERGAGILSGIQ